MDILYIISESISIIGVVIMCWGVLLAIVRFLKSELHNLKKLPKEHIQKERIYLRQNLGSYILLGLEFMVAGDIIHTVLKPDMNALIILGSIVAIRTVISYFLNKEIKG